MRRAARTDNNQNAIREAMEKCGASVLSLAQIGKGCPDLLVAFRGKNYLVEVKNGDRYWSMTQDQREFHTAWMAPIAVLDSVEAAIDWLKKLAN